MMIYMSCAKTMAARNRQEVPFTTPPLFRKGGTRKCPAHGTIQFRRVGSSAAHKQ